MLKQLSLQPKEWTMQYTKMNKVETYVMLCFLWTTVCRVHRLHQNRDKRKTSKIQ